MRVLAVSTADKHMEGDIWFCKLLGATYVAPEDMLHSSDEIQKGWWVVKAQYYKRVQRAEARARCELVPLPRQACLV